MYLITSLFSVDNAKVKRGLLYKSIYFWCHDTTLKKVFSIEKLNLT